MHGHGRQLLGSFSLAALATLAFHGTALAKDVYVSVQTGNEDNPGTKEAPKKVLWKAMKALAAGDNLLVAEGRYEGQGKSACLPQVSVGNVKLEGGWKKDFSERDPFKYITEIATAPDDLGAGGKVFHFESPDNKIDNVTLDGFMVDRGASNYYFGTGEPGANKSIEGHADNSPWGYQALNKKKSGSDPTVQLIGNGSFTVRNMILVNNPWWGIYVKCGGSNPTTIENNLVLLSHGRAIEAIAGGGWGKPTITIKNNTVLFSHAFGGGEGRALSLDPKADAAKYVIEANVLACSDGGGIDTKFGMKGDSVTLTNNLFFFNRLGDTCVANAGGVGVKEFGDQLEITSAKGNVSELPKAIAKVAPFWLDQWSSREFIDMLASKFNKPEDLVAIRAAGGLPAEYTIPGYDKKYPDYKSLPQKRPQHELGRYPCPKKKGEAIDWAKDAVALVGADGERGVHAFAAPK